MPSNGIGFFAGSMRGSLKSGLIIFVIAAVITPTPDPYNQSLVAGPLFFLYFIGIFFAWILQPRKKTPAS